MAGFDRGFVVLGGLSGALGVGLSAAAAHAGGSNLQTAASFLLMHAPALLVAALLVQSRRVVRIGFCILAVGLALFCGDLVARHVSGERLFPFAAPLGGLLMIAGWLVVAISALFERRAD